MINNKNHTLFKPSPKKYSYLHSTIHQDKFKNPNKQQNNLTFKVFFHLPNKRNCLQNIQNLLQMTTQIKNKNAQESFYFRNKRQYGKRSSAVFRRVEQKIGSKLRKQNLQNLRQESLKKLNNVSINHKKKPIKEVIQKNSQSSPTFKLINKKPKGRVSCINNTIKSQIEEQLKDKRETLSNKIKENRRCTLKQNRSLYNIISQIKSSKLKRNEQQCKVFDDDNNQKQYYISNLNQNSSVYGRCLEHLSYSIKIIHMMNNLIHPSNLELKQKKIKLIKKFKNKKTILFDLDQTLIHCNQSSDLPYDVLLKIQFFHSQIYQLPINIRPYARQTLQILSKKFEIIIFTASHPAYANPIIDYIDPQSKWISHRLFRDSCLQIQPGIFVKDLRIFQNRNLRELLLVDNAAYSYYYQLENGIPIIPYYKGKDDQELKYLTRYLLELEQCEDVRIINKERFKLQKYEKYNEACELVEELYGKGFELN